MTTQDQLSLRMLGAAAADIAAADGPIDSVTAVAALSSLGGIILSRPGPISMQTLDAIVTLMEAVRDEITS